MDPQRSLLWLCLVGLSVGCTATPEPQVQPVPPLAPPVVGAAEVPAAETAPPVAEPPVDVPAPPPPVEPVEPTAAAEPTVDDEVIATKILIKFASDARLSLYEIDVASRDGRVVLSGRVGSAQAVEAAAALARQTAGVRSVENRLTAD
jgi:hypothetical protein